MMCCVTGSFKGSLAEDSDAGSITPDKGARDKGAR